MLNNIKTKNSGFTIVELLIVIVVIAILAAITIVAYNGIQNSAKNSTAKETANQIRTKVEAYNAKVGNYPASGATGAATATTLGTQTESKLDTDVAGKLADTSGAVDQAKPVHWASCTATGATAPTGGTVTYWQASGTSPLTYTLGSC